MKPNKTCHQELMLKCDEALESWVVHDKSPSPSKRRRSWVKRSLKCVEDGTIWQMVHGFTKQACEHHRSSYADALDKDERGADHVGDAIALLSYSWAEKYHDVFDALHDWAVREGHEPKRAYVWVCALCLNQVSAL